MNPVGRRVTKSGKTSQTRGNPFPHFHQTYQNHCLSFSQHNRLGYIKLNSFFHFITSKQWLRDPGSLLLTQGLHPRSLLLASSVCFSFIAERVLIVLGVSCPNLKRQHHCCPHSIGQTQWHGPSLTAREAGNCSFPMYPGRGKGIGGLLTSLGHSCLLDIFDISHSWHVPFAALVKAWVLEQRRITSVVPCVQSLLDEALNFFRLCCSL